MFNVTLFMFVLALTSKKMATFVITNKIPVMGIVTNHCFLNMLLFLTKKILRKVLSTYTRLDKNMPC